MPEKTLMCLRIINLHEPPKVMIAIGLQNWPFLLAHSALTKAKQNGIFKLIDLTHNRIHVLHGCGFPEIKVLPIWALWEKWYGINIEENEPSDVSFGLGGDAKIAVTPGLNLDLTINPDFSQVEVDRQVTNLTRFEIFFPERRQFFLENSDLFGSFGEDQINPFFSRRIGVSKDTTEDSTIENPILFGARLSGKLDNNWRVGFLDMQTAKDDVNGLPSFNYMVSAVQRNLFSRSNIGFIFVNKQTFQEEYSKDAYNEFNRVVGVDYNLNSADNAWTGKVFYHRSIGVEKLDKEFAHGARLRYTRRRFELEWNHQWVGENYDAEVGFVPRINFFRLNPQAELFFYNDKGQVNQHGPSIVS